MAMSKPVIPMNPAVMNASTPFVMTEERSARSVFVGNIPYDTSEELLRSIFNQAGNVISFKMVYDRETGKPKGYGFCEYQDQEMANSAMRNLNNYDINGRQLRVGVAVGDQINEARAIFAPPSESPYGEVMEPEKAPEAISKAVASLPPEQMFELMKQMKLCIQNNPNEARHMLLQNPQLSYALLQAQIVMKIVDPQVALAMLYRPAEQIPPILPATNGDKLPAPSTIINQPQGQPRPERPERLEFGRNVNTGGMRPRGGLLGDMPAPMSNYIPEETDMDIGFQQEPHNYNEIRPLMRPDQMGPNLGPRSDFQGPRIENQGPRPEYFGPRQEPRSGQIRPLYRPGRGPEMGKFGSRSELEMRPIGPRDSRFSGPMGRNVPGLMDRNEPRPMGRNEPGPMGRNEPGPVGRNEPGPMGRNEPGPMGRNELGPMGRSEQGPMGRNEPGPMGRNEPGSIGRSETGPMGRNEQKPMSRNESGPIGRNEQGPISRNEPGPLGRNEPMEGRSIGDADARNPRINKNEPAPTNSKITPQDHEKAALIMQVLQLTDEQISMLPQDQRQSILILKEQIAKSSVL